MFKALTSLTTLVAAAITSSPAFARSNVYQHQQLWRAVESVGVQVRVNQSRDCDPDVTGFKAYGWYNGITRTLVVCQEDAIKAKYFDQGMVPWTEEDFDTLRHEAHHLVQDCRDGYLNADLDSVYRQPIEFSLKVLGERKARRVVELYQERGNHIVVMELEAFSVAQLNDPQEQVSDINRYCF